MSAFSKIKDAAELVKFSHTIFALPFALAGMLVAADGLPAMRVVFLILICMVFARTAAMAFNRFLDADIDARNPRTSGRSIPKKVFSRGAVLAIAIACAAAFVFVTALINPLCFKLSVPALGLLFGYSYTKRFTRWCHLVLGLALGISPVAAWIAVTGVLSPVPVLLGVGVSFWVAGFDILYAAQDYDFDRTEGLHSVVTAFGIAKALWVSRIFHVLTIIFLSLFGLAAGLGLAYFLTLILVAGLLIYEQSLVRADDLIRGDFSRIGAAFFNVNGFISLIFLAGIILSLSN